MTDYSQNTSFGPKDSLATGHPDKVVSGTELDSEFSEIETAIGTKIDAPASPSEGEVLTYSSGAWTSAVAIPAGVVMHWAAAAGAPTGWLLCDGRAISRTTYAALYSAIGETWGVGDGSTTFNIPDLRGRVVVALDDMGTATGDALRLANTTFSSGGRSSVGSTAGTDTHTLTVAQIPAHDHDVTVDLTDGIAGTVGSGANTGGTSVNTTSIASAGGGGSHPNVQPMATIMTIIKT